MTRSYIKLIAIVALALRMLFLSSCHAPKNLLQNCSTKGVKVFVLSDVDANNLSFDNVKILDALSMEIKATGPCQVTVIGHADNTGTSEVNEAVSAKRARMVAEHLKKRGIPTSPRPGSRTTILWRATTPPRAAPKTAAWKFMSLPSANTILINNA